ncbi:MAG: heavy metal translocating P-type ATPase, partial [Acidimicrobiales bacterium]
MHGDDVPHAWGMTGSRLRQAIRFTRTNGQLVLLVVVLLGLAGGGLAWLVGARGVMTIAWVLTTSIGVVAASWWIYQSILDHRLGGDIVALLALVGTLVVHEELAGAVISMMLATGRALEHFASQRAERELRGLLARAPRWARRRRGGAIEKVLVEVIVPGDLLSVSRGDIVPTDGRVMSQKAILDESALTGEAFPVERAEDDLVRSGVVNVGDAFDLQATTTAAEGTYSGIVRLVHEAESQKAPLVRMADRYALWFLVLAV